MSTYLFLGAAGEKAIAAWNWLPNQQTPSTSYFKVGELFSMLHGVDKEQTSNSLKVSTSCFLVCWAKDRFKLTFNSVAKIFATHTANNFLKTPYMSIFLFCIEAEMIFFGKTFL